MLLSTSCRTDGLRKRPRYDPDKDTSEDAQDGLRSRKIVMSRASALDFGFATSFNSRLASSVRNRLPLENYDLSFLLLSFSSLKSPF